jgi:hypothetical protein
LISVRPTPGSQDMNGINQDQRWEIGDCMA